MNILIIFSKNKTICKYLLLVIEAVLAITSIIFIVLDANIRKNGDSKREILELYKIKGTRFILVLFIYISVINYIYNPLNVSYIYCYGEREALILSIFFLTTESDFLLC